MPFRFVYLAPWYFKSYSSPRSHKILDLFIQKKRKEEAEIRRNKKEEEEEEARSLEEDTRKRHEVRYLLVDITSRLFVFVATVNLLQQSIPR